MVDEPGLAALSGILAADSGISAALLFGSVARGAARPESDIDIAVLYESAATRLAHENMLTEFLGELGISAGRDVHLVDLTQTDCALRRTIFATGQTLFDRSGSRLRDLKASTLIEYFDWEYARKIIDRGLRQRLAQVRA